MPTFQEQFQQYLSNSYYPNDPALNQGVEPNVVEPINTFDISPELKKKLKKERKTISPIRQYANDTLQFDETTGTGQFDFSDPFKLFNIAAQGITGFANANNDAKNRRLEEQMYLQSIMPKPSFNYNEDGLNNIPMYKGGGQNPAKVYTDRKQFEQAQRMYKGGGSNIPTTSDSLNVMNQALKVEKYYDNLQKLGWYDKERTTTSTSTSEVKNFFNKTRLNKISEESLNTYKNHYEYPSRYREFHVNDVYPNIKDEDIKKAAKKSINEILTKPNNIYIYKDLYPVQIDEWAPSTMIDMNITPQYIKTYYKSKKVADLNKNVPGGLLTSIMTYDPIAVKPAHLKTAADWAYLKKTYGTKISNQIQTSKGNTGSASLGSPKPQINNTPKIVAPTHPIQKMDRINPQQMDLNSNINIQGKQVPFPQFQLPQQKGTPVYGPGNTIIGYSDNMNFKPAYQYTGAPNNQLNLQDKELLNNPEALRKYILSKDNYKFSQQEFKNGGENDWHHNVDDIPFPGYGMTPLDPKNSKYFQDEAFIGPPNYPANLQGVSNPQWSFRPVRVDYNQKYIPYKQYPNPTAPVRQHKLKKEVTTVDNIINKVLDIGSTEPQVQPITGQKIFLDPNNPTMAAPQNDIWNNPNGSDQLPVEPYERKGTGDVKSWFATGGYNEGEEIDLTEEQIKEMQKAGFRFEIL